MKKPTEQSEVDLDAVVTGVCEFCGQTKPTVSTTFHGFYCRECIELSIEQDKEALHSLRSLRKDTKANKIEAKKKMDKAYEDLVRGL